MQYGMLQHHSFWCIKSARAKLVTDYRPIVTLRLLYKTFSYLVLSRIEALLEAGQPEEQHGFRQNRRLEEHLLTTNMVLDTSRAVGLPVWVLSLDLSKAFDRVDWKALWAALHDHGISPHMIWIIQRLYSEQVGQVTTSTESSKEFPIRAGVRQGCVLSPRLFCAVLEWAMRNWKQAGQHDGIQLQRNAQALTDLRFADDILLFALSLQQILSMLRSLVLHLRQVGLVLNASKTKLMTTQAQPSDRVWFQEDSYINVVHGSSSHKWLGCQLSMDGDHTADVEFHLHAAARAFWANRWILRDKHVPLSLRVKFFEAVVTQVACFGAGHRKISILHLCKLDSEWRRFLRSMVGPPSGLDWSLPWHEVLHNWNHHVQEMTRNLQLQSWSCRCLHSHWNLAHHVATLPEDRWVKRAMKWSPVGVRILGRPRNSWQTHLECFARFSGFDSWSECVSDFFTVARDAFSDFVQRRTQ